jgi:hypothetical protein
MGYALGQILRSDSRGKSKKILKSYCKSLASLNSTSFPRRYSPYKPKTVQLLSFCDASPKAYSTAIYIRTADSEERVSSRLVCAKTRVAPIKTITIPRLELQGALMLVKLVNRVRKLLNIDMDCVYAFCDSQITLAWIRGPGENYETFVRNRVLVVQSLCPYKR